MGSTISLREVRDPYAWEKLTIGAAASGLTTTKITPAAPSNPGSGSRKSAEIVLITVETDSIRWTVDGTTPTGANGHLSQAGDVIELVGINSIRAFLAIRVTTDATIQVTYSR